MARLQVKVVPGSSRDAIVGCLGDAVKIRIAAPPERGQANARLIDFLATSLGLSRSHVRVVVGAACARKTVEVDNLGEEEIRRRLGLPK